jgi:hypothetical protein
MTFRTAVDIRESRIVSCADIEAPDIRLEWIGCHHLWLASVVAVLLAGAFASRLFDPVVLARDPVDPVVVIRPPTGVGSGTGSFEYLDSAIDEFPYTGAVGSVAVMCRSTCMNAVEKVGVWQGFPDGFEPLRLEIRWDAVGGVSLDPGRTAEVHLFLEYDLGSGWETAQEETWSNVIPGCSEAHPSRCADNVYVKDLDPQQSTGAIKVRATVRIQMTACGNCGLFDTSQMNAIMAVRNIQVVARAPRLIAEPGYTVTRGDTVTFRVVGAPIESYSNWRYQFQPIVHPDVVRTENINTGQWTGPLLLSGRAKVVVIVPGQSVSIPLETEPVMTVNPLVELHPAADTKGYWDRSSAGSAGPAGQ